MKKTIIICVIISTLLLAQTPYIPIERSGDELIEPQGPGEINWTKQVIKAKGWGIIDTIHPKAQAKILATTAAIAVAQRNLLEIVKGVRVVSEVKVQDMMNKSDYIYKRIEGVIKGAQMVGEPIEKEGVIEVEMAIGIYDSKGIAPPLQEALEVKLKQIAELPEKDRKEIEKITGIVIDARDINAKPSLFPKILDKNGTVLFDPAEYYNPNDPRLQKIIKVLTIAEQEIKKTELGDNPYVIKALKAINSDIVVSDEEAKKVNWLKKTFQALLKIGKALWVLL